MFHFFQRNIRSAEDGIGTKGVDEAPVLAGHIDDHRLAGVSPIGGLDSRGIDAVFSQHVSDDPAKEVAADPAHNRGGDSHLD